MPNKPYKDIKCGTYSGYQRHYRLKELACDACKKGAAEYVKKHYYNNTKKILERIKKYQKNNPKRKLIKERTKARRRARLKGCKTEPYTLAQVFDTYGYNCYLCNKLIDLKAPRQAGKPGWEMGLHIDHYIDIQHGGGDTLENVRPTHGICNLRKNKKREAQLSAPLRIASQ